MEKKKPDQTVSNADHSGGNEQHREHCDAAARAAEHKHGVSDAVSSVEPKDKHTSKGNDSGDDSTDHETQQSNDNIGKGNVSSTDTVSKEEIRENTRKHGKRMGHGTQDTAGNIKTGNTPSDSTGINAPPDEPAQAREDIRLTVSRRLQRDGRWKEAEPIRDRLMKEGKSRGLRKPEAQQAAYTALDEMFPPLPEPDPEEATPALPPQSDEGVKGLGDIPSDWPTLPANASLQAEISWVQANRLQIVEGNTVYLERSLGPAPSYAALGWLETSIRAYSKFMDIAARATAGQGDEAESVRRERVSIEEMRTLLQEMAPVCPHCGKALA